MSINPALPAQVIGVHQRAEAEHAGSAMEAAQTAFESWRRTSAAERAGLLFRAAGMIRERKFEFCAWLRDGSRQELGGGRCGCGRDDRLSGVLRTGGVAAG